MKLKTGIRSKKKGITESLIINSIFNNSVEIEMINISAKDKDMGVALKEMICYISSTYGDKYAKSDLDNTGIIYSKSNGKGFNIGNATKYLARYLTTGFVKSEMPDDLKKAVHYIIFEYIRKTLKL